MMPFKATKDIQLPMFIFYPPMPHYVNPELTITTASSYVLKSNNSCVCNLPNAQLFWTHLTDWGYRKNNIWSTNTLRHHRHRLSVYGLNLCIIIAKYYIFTAPQNEEDYSLDALLAILRNNIQMETSRVKVQAMLKKKTL